MQWFTDTLMISKHFKAVSVMDPFVRKFSRLYELSADEVKMLTDLHGDCKPVKPRTTIVLSGDPVKHACLIQDGWAMMYKELADGRQQILSFALPGDFLNLFDIMLGKAEYSIVTITRARICPLHWDRMIEIFKRFPRLAMAICWFGARHQLLLREQVIRIGRQSAFNRIGHIVLELYERLDKTGLIENNSFEFPITQEMLADALGLTTIHINRTMKKLRQSGLIEITDSRLTVPDRAGLARTTDFDDSYIKYPDFPDDIVHQPDVTAGR